MNTLAEHWASYAAQIMPADAGPAQRHGTKCAFYAGAAAFYAQLAQVRNEGMLDALRAELRDFAETVGRGGA